MSEDMKVKPMQTVALENFAIVESFWFFHAKYPFKMAVVRMLHVQRGLDAEGSSSP